MSAEYVKIAPTEMIFGETNLLQIQLNLLKMLKQYQEYETFRKEELFLKIELKKKLGETKEFLDILSKSLPESRFIEEQEKKERLQKELAEKVDAAIQTTTKKEWKYWKEKETEIKEDKPAEKEDLKEKSKTSTLDQELEEIRKKLERLQ